MTETLRGEKAIKHCALIHSKPDPSLTPPIREILMFFDTGTALNGYPGVCHGGFVATILDEVTGFVQNVNVEYQNTQSGQDTPVGHMTAYLNTKYLAPVPTPSILLATGRIIKAEGRKLFLEGTLENDKGEILAQCECLYVEARKDPRASAKL